MVQNTKMIFLLFCCCCCCLSTNLNLLRRKQSTDSFCTQAVRWRRRRRKKRRRRRRRLWRWTFHLMRSTFDTHNNNNENNYMKTKLIKAHEILRPRIMMKNHKKPSCTHTGTEHDFQCDWIFSLAEYDFYNLWRLSTLHTYWNCIKQNKNEKQKSNLILIT